MMPMQMRRKTQRIEKVENLSRTATVQNILPTRGNKSDHACAIRWTNFLRVDCRPVRAPRGRRRRRSAPIGPAVAIDLAVRDRDPAGDCSLTGYESFRFGIL